MKIEVNDLINSLNRFKAHSKKSDYATKSIQVLLIKSNKSFYIHEIDSKYYIDTDAIKPII